jgi:integral membrane protein
VTEPAPASEAAARTNAVAARAIDRLRSVGKIEAVSFLVLLGVAMPLKYLAGIPLAVKAVGWAHGVLFIWFCIALGRAKLRAELPMVQVLGVFIAALVPFGPFVIDRRLERAAKARAR